MKNFQARGSIRDNRTSYVYYSGDAGEVCKVQVAYDEGGYSFIDYKHKPRGIKLTVSVVKLLVRDGKRIGEEYAPLADCNFRIMVEEAKRYNAKRLAIVAEELDEFAAKFAELYLTDRKAAVELLKTTLDIKEAA